MESLLADYLATVEPPLATTQSAKTWLSLTGGSRLQEPDHRALCREEFRRNTYFMVGN